eukprot:2562434-Prorocentrum_lima.AAC.1
MTSSLVGSEMCIRDRTSTGTLVPGASGSETDRETERDRERERHAEIGTCLLYTSDAADDM